MEFIDALAIVRDLANENILELQVATQNVELFEERDRQRKAVDKVDDFLTLLRGHHL